MEETPIKLNDKELREFYKDVLTNFLKEMPSLYAATEKSLAELKAIEEEES